MKCAAVIARMENFQGTKKWFVNDPYVEAITKLGWAMYPITSYPSLTHALATCDCLIVPGGYDLQGYYVKESRRKECTYYDSALDHFDLDCIDVFVKAAKPILGICRGLQLLNIYFGGTLLTHIDEEQHALTHKHRVHMSAHSFLSQLYDDPFEVNSYHHQVIGKLGSELIAAAYSEEMYVEAIQGKQQSILGVQWHPELMEHDQIFSYFFDILCA